MIPKNIGQLPLGRGGHPLPPGVLFDIAVRRCFGDGSGTIYKTIAMGTKCEGFVLNPIDGVIFVKTLIVYNEIGWIR